VASPSVLKCSSAISVTPYSARHPLSMPHELGPVEQPLGGE
jgi:hypothetical protein